MTVTYGFYNSVNGDRAYNSSQLSRLFQGIITDGVFMSVGDGLAVQEGIGMNIQVKSGRAWFNNTWTDNDSVLTLAVAAADALLGRKDILVLEVNAADASRVNSFKIVTGTPASIPIAPTLVETEHVHQHLMAIISVPAGITQIQAAHITNEVGTTYFPYITGVMSTLSSDAIVAQWESEFDIWFDAMKGQLTTDAAGNLQTQINALTIHDKASKADPVDADEIGLVDSAASNLLKKLTWANFKATLAKIHTPADGWVYNANSFTYVSPTTMTTSGNQTGLYRSGMKIKLTNGGSTKYFYVLSAVYTTLTTITLLSESVLVSGGITNVYYSRSSILTDFPSWFSFTPVWYSQSGTNPVIGNGTLQSTYRVDGQMITWRGLLVIGSTTTLGTGNWAFTMPAQVVGLWNYYGLGYARDTGVTNYFFTLQVQQSTLDLRFIMDSTKATNNSNVSATVPYSWGANDSFNWMISYPIG